MSRPTLVSAVSVRFESSTMSRDPGSPRHIPSHPSNRASRCPGHISGYTPGRHSNGINRPRAATVVTKDVQCLQPLRGSGGYVNGSSSTSSRIQSQNRASGRLIGRGERLRMSSARRFPTDPLGSLGACGWRRYDPPPAGEHVGRIRSGCGCPDGVGERSARGV
jgi:hypothetical protein